MFGLGGGGGMSPVLTNMLRALRVDIQDTEPVPAEKAEALAEMVKRSTETPGAEVSKMTATFNGRAMVLVMLMAPEGA